MAQYHNGTRFEYLVRDLYREDGAFVIRSAGSKGAVDLIAWYVFEGKAFVDLIQCKKEKKKANYKEDIAALRAVPAGDDWRKMLWVKSKGKIQVFLILKGEERLIATMDVRGKEIGD